jgi:hypothetical protein
MPSDCHIVLPTYLFDPGEEEGMAFRVSMAVSIGFCTTTGNLPGSLPAALESRSVQNSAWEA